MAASGVRRPFVLVHGGGAGGWCWDPVVPLLEAGGHAVAAPSLSGLRDPSTRLDRHADDVVQVFERDDLQEAVLVGHSYGGMVITVVAERIPDRIARLVYLDAFAPQDGESAFDCRPDLAPAFHPLVRDGLLPPIDPEFAGVETEEQARLLQERLTTLPIGLMEENVVLRNPLAATLPRTYVLCRRSGFRDQAARAGSAGWDCRELDAKHMVMLTAPDALAGLLLELAAD